ncbi:preprotein translocase subunit SecE [Buchnera aphidicola]|uniref:Protein translocase subunit SecE n=1 Tax=Buchnera aphidicola (Cinara cf. splendens/pseudotsugae 3390) TaxID=2518980 RepID=A0A451CWK5_9GAMM|nr:preprotein translocase subunit SecE [Buchnera aphidicola]VFP77600.1 Protein translocase subunit SecE [Buchnera aphidicola (Cinara cf. splendens/pseudotsugae 3390)]
MHIHKLYNIYTKYTEKIKWLCITIIIICMILNYIFFIHQYSKNIKIIFFVIYHILLFSIFLSTFIGKKTIIFAKDVNMELSKIIWPTYKETCKTTSMVLLLITLTSIFLWILDGIILHAISWILR